MWRLAAVLLATPAWASPHGRYRAAAKDFAAFQDGILLTRKVQPDLFPNGVDSVAGVLYDGSRLYVYSRKKDLPFQKWKTWKDYQIYRVPYQGEFEPRQWGGCRGGGGTAVEKGGLKGRLRQNYFECAPLATFLEVQKRKKGSIYTSRESYLATVVHEAAHQYQEQLTAYERPAVLDELIARIDVIVPGSSDLGASSIREGYAQWCELAASEKRLPDHFRKLLGDKVARNDEPHDVGLRAVQALWRSKHPPAPAP